MSDAGSKGSSGWMRVGLVVGCLFLVALAVVLVATFSGAAKLRRLHSMAQVRLAKTKAIDGRRPVLRGTAEGGNAWDDYALAVAETKRFADARKLRDVVDRTPQADPSVAAEALANHGAAAEFLRKGAGRDSSRYPYEWEKGPAMAIPGLLEMQQTSYLAILQARAHFEAGRSREGAGVLLDVLQFGRDLGANGLLITEMVGMALLSSGMAEIQEGLAAGRFDRAALEDLGRGLATLDGSFPDHGQALLNDTILFAGLADEKTVGSWGPQGWMFAGGIERMQEWMLRVDKAETLPWADAQREYQAIEEEVQKTWNPVAKVSAPSLLKSCKSIRERRAQLRLLRVAVAHLAGAELPVLDDPFGAKLQTAKGEGGFKVWSVGSDGVDNGGTGEWKVGGPDIVLSVKK